MLPAAFFAVSTLPVLTMIVAAAMGREALTLRKSPVGLTRMIQIAGTMFGAGLIFFGLSHVLWLSLVLMVFVGFGLMQGASASNTVIQSLVPEDKRARAMSYYTMAFFGGAPFGSLLAGTLAHHIGALYTVMFTGAFCVAEMASPSTLRVSAGSMMPSSHSLALA